ncbi:MAG: ribosome maturation factor RimP [Acidobacteria bacterium]|nr:MAG: ribosome maturation factor RimP [Acidobacteriota bacterium]
MRRHLDDVAQSHGLEVFDLSFRREAPGWVLRVMLDRATGEVGIEDCQRVSRELSAWLDVEDETLGPVLGDSYTLEVSSAGLDRPLRLERGDQDFRRFEGRLAKVVTREPVNGQSAFAGRLAGVEDGHVLMTEGRRTHKVPLDKISRARLDVEF